MLLLKKVKNIENDNDKNSKKYVFFNDLLLNKRYIFKNGSCF